MDNTFTIEMTEPELIYFGNLLELPGLVPSDEWQTLDEDAIEALMLRAQESLAEKNFIRLTTGEDGSLVVDQTIAALVSVLGYPQYGFAAQSFREKRIEPEQLKLFGLGNLLVELRQGADDNHTLTACRTPEVAIERLFDFLGLREQPAAHDESFCISAGDMAQVPFIIAGNGAEDAAVFLRDNGVPKKAANRLACAMGNPVRQSLVQTATWIDGELQEAPRLTLLEEVYGLWLIVPTGDDGNMLDVMPSTAAEAVAQIRELVFAIIPSEAA